MITYPVEGGTWYGANVIETSEGKKYDFLNPNPRDITIEDIAHGLSNTCRFGGHCKVFYSVAQHSVLVSELVSRRWHSLELSQAALLHDAHEAFLGDAPRPIKPLLGQKFRDLADLSDRAIAEHFEITVDAMKDKRIKEADVLALVNEGHELMVVGPPPEEYEALPDGMDVPAPLSPADAKAEFLNTASRLGLY